MKKTTSIKIKAGALQFVVFTGLVIAILLAAFVTLTHVHTLFKKQTGLTIETVKSTDLGIYNAINASSAVTESSTNISIKSSTEFWGVFEKIIATSNLKKNKFTKAALIGGNTLNKTALYLKENNQPLIIVGNTKIEGTSFIPKQGVKAGNISGNSYYGTSLIYGNTRKSAQKLPTPKNLNQFNNKNYIDIFKREQLIVFKIGISSYKNSFLEPTKLLYDNAPIHLSGIQLTGNIIIQSESAITIDNSALLKDVVLIAPKIDILDEVKGTFQAIASASITVGKNCLLEYPSALLLKTTSKSISDIENQQIFFGPNSSLKGIIAYVGEDIQQKQRFKPQLVIEKGAIVHGEVFCEANTELKGAVYGSLYTSRFISSTAGSVYLNHIFNGQITATALPDEYVGLTFDTNKREIAKWLY